MKAQVPDITLTYFPYTFLEENDLKRLLLYCDSIRLLQVLADSDPGLPDSLQSSQAVQLFCPISASSLSAAVKQALLTCHQLGNIHRDGGLVDLFRTFALEQDFEGSRTGLVARLRQGRPLLAPAEEELVNNAVFLLLAHQLDHDQSELDLELERIGQLENKFYAEVGIGAEEEKDFEPLRSSLSMESDRARTQYPFQRLRAWTHLYRAQKKPALFLPLTTSTEVLAEIAERLPFELTPLTQGLPAMPLKQQRLAILPDPQNLSLEEILEMRKSLDAASVLGNWRASFSAAISRLQQETLSQEEWTDLGQQLQKAADSFRQHWPTKESSVTYLQLECICYPRLEAELAFSLATGLTPEVKEVQAPEGANGITLLLSSTVQATDDTD
jgi:hypothetical protein